MVFHILKKDRWLDVKSNTNYIANSLSREGYIHCSFENQVVKVAETFYKGQGDLVILCINESKLNDILKIEDLFNLKEKYPHIYGPIPLNCIENIIELKLDNNGDFIKPNFKPLSSLVVEQGEWT